MHAPSSIRPRNLAPLGALLSAVLALGCGRAILSGPVDARSSEFLVTVHKVQDGPDHISTAGRNYRAASGERFLHFKVTLKNLTNREQSFHWDRCGVPCGTLVSCGTALVFYDSVVSATHSATEELDPDEEVHRKVIIPFPEHLPYPSRLSCDGLTLPLSLNR